MENIEKLEKWIKISKKNKLDMNKYDLEEILHRIPVIRKMQKNRLPVNKANHVGIEIEFYSKWLRSDIYYLICNKKLQEKVSLTEDGSLDNNGHEMRILDSEKNILKTLLKVCKIFKMIDATVKNNCGLHVHLDMRNRNVDTVYANLLKVQPIMFGLVKSNRTNNSYCQPSTPHSKDERYSAINYCSYRKFKTLEIRLHQGSVDFKEIALWLKFLFTVVKSKYKNEMTKLTDLKLDKALEKPLMKKFKQGQVKRGQQIPKVVLSDQEMHEMLRTGNFSDAYRSVMQNAV